MCDGGFGGVAGFCPSCGAGGRQRIIMSSFDMQRLFPAGREYEIDPVCEMKVDPQNPSFQFSHRGKTYYFCSPMCKHLFERVPEQYVKTEKE